MPALLPVPGCVRVDQNFANVRGWKDTFHVQHLDLSPWTIAELTELAATCNTYLGDVYIPVMCNGASGGGTNCTDLSDDVGRVGGSGPGWNGAGGAISTPLNSTMVTTFVIPRSYRGGHPRFMCGGIAQEVMSNPYEWGSAACLGVDTRWATLQSAIAGGGGTYGPSQLVAVSRYAAGALRPAPVTYPVSRFETQQRVCTLRKRLGKPVAEL